MDIDKGMRYLVGLGDHQLVILNLGSQEHKIYDLDLIKYEKIIAFRLKSNSGANQDYVCHIACKKKDMKQIVIFDIIEEEKSERDRKIRRNTLKFAKI